MLMARWYIDYREKGTNPRCGDFYRADTDAERDEVAGQLKGFGTLRVVWTKIED